MTDASKSVSVNPPIKQAIISVSDKTDVIEFARGLAACGVHIISTGGTAEVLRPAGIDVEEVSDYTGFSEMLDGRVKTLHPKVLGGILFRRDIQEHVEAVEKAEIPPIDLVVCNLYPFVQTIAKANCTLADAIEKIDVGGPTMVRSAAKNWDHVAVVTDPMDYVPILAEIKESGGLSADTRFRLAQKAFSHTAAYDGAISNYLTALDSPDGERALFPACLNLHFDRVHTLRYGENPHQKAAWYATQGKSLPRVIQGKPLSYTNVRDLDAAYRIACSFTEPAATVLKHRNPCGAAVADSCARAYMMARDADPVSAFGGIVGVNRSLDAATAALIVQTFIECVIAPGVDEEARRILATKENMRVVIAPLVLSQLEMCSAFDSILIQERDFVSEALEEWGPDNPHLKVVTNRAPTPWEWRQLRFAWTVCAHVISNAVILTRDVIEVGDSRPRPQHTYGIGGGQPNRVGSAEIAAGALLPGGRRELISVAASDAFFPYRDGLDVLGQAKVSAVVQPGGSVRDEEVIAAADHYRMAMVFTGVRHFRH